MPFKLATRSGMLNMDSPEDYTFTVGEIAESLSMTNRFAGHRGWDSVAGHAVRVANMVEREVLSETLSTKYRAFVVLRALHHDDSEAYLGDQSSPLRKYLDRDEESELEFFHENLQFVIEKCIFPSSQSLMKSHAKLIVAADRSDGLIRLGAVPDAYMTTVQPRFRRDREAFLNAHYRLMRALNA